MSKIISVLAVFMLCWQTFAMADDYAADAITKADEFYRSGDNEAAEKVLSDAISKSNKNAKLYRYRATLRIMRNSIDEAENDFREVVKIDENSSFAWNYIGIIEIKKDNYNEALAAFTKASTIDGGWQSFKGKSSANIKLRNYNDALIDVNKSIDAVSRDKDSASITPELILQRAQIYESLGNSELALRDFQQSASLGHSDAALAGIQRLSAGQDICTEEKILSIGSALNFNKEQDDPTIIIDMIKQIFGKDINSMEKSDFVQIKKDVDNCLNSKKIELSQDNTTMIRKNLDIAIKNLSVRRDNIPPKIEENVNTNGPTSEQISILTALFQQYSIATLCSEVGNTFSNEDITKINETIKAELKSKSFTDDPRVTSMWNNISRQINANKSLLTQADCTQTYQWFASYLPNLKLGSSEPFPFQ